MGDTKSPFILTHSFSVNSYYPWTSSLQLVSKGPDMLLEAWNRSTDNEDYCWSTNFLNLAVLIIPLNADHFVRRKQFEYRSLKGHRRRWGCSGALEYQFQSFPGQFDYFEMPADWINSELVVISGSFSANFNNLT